MAVIVGKPLFIFIKKTEIIMYESKNLMTAEIE